MDNRLTTRATVLKAWMGSESYAMVQAILHEYHAARMQALLSGSREQFDHNVGYLMGLTEAIRVAEQVVLDEARQRPQESNGAGR